MSRATEALTQIVSQLQDLQTEGDLPDEVKETLESHASDLKALNEELIEAEKEG